MIIYKKVKTQKKHMKRRRRRKQQLFKTKIKPLNQQDSGLVATSKYNNQKNAQYIAAMIGEYICSLDVQFGKIDLDICI